MNAITAPKSHRLNLLEGITLTAMFQAVPVFASTVLLLKFTGSESSAKPAAPQSSLCWPR